MALWNQVLLWDLIYFLQCMLQARLELAAYSIKTLQKLLPISSFPDVMSSSPLTLLMLALFNLLFKKLCHTWRHPNRPLSSSLSSQNEIASDSVEPSVSYRE